MKLAIILLVLAVAPGAVSVAGAADAEPGLDTIKALGSVNGQALACSEVQVAARAKSMMLAHAPKTALYGTAYEEATQAAYLAQTRSASACPDNISLLARLNQLALQLAAALPVAAPQSK
jgi:hypothetical protein